MDLSLVANPASNPALLVFAAFMPLLISFVKQAGWTRSANSIVALVVYIAVGVLGVALSGQAITLDNIVPLATTLAVVGSVAYGIFWNQLGVSDEGESIDTRLTVFTSIVK